MRWSNVRQFNEFDVILLEMNWIDEELRVMTSRRRKKQTMRGRSLSVRLQMRAPLRR
jgi:hypothetical protein